MNIGKPYEGEPHVRFDEERLKISALYSSNRQDNSVKHGTPWVTNVFSKKVFFIWGDSSSVRDCVF
jgi:hypothetical protein